MGRLPYWSARSAGYSITRLRLGSPPSLSCFAAFALMRRSFEARVDRVAMSDRGTKVKVARRTGSARQSRASFRFCSCVRKRSARMTSTPSFVSRRPGQPYQLRTDGGRQARRAGDIEAQLDGGRNLVHVLPAWSRDAYELLAQLRLRDIDGARHAQQPDASLVPSVAPEPDSAPRCFASPTTHIDATPCTGASSLPV